MVDDQQQSQVEALLSNTSNKTAGRKGVQHGVYP